MGMGAEIGRKRKMKDRWADLIIAGLIGFGALLMVASYLLIVAAAWRVVFGG